MPELVSPGVNWCGPVAVALNSEVVNTSADAEETLLTPVGTPGVSHGPIWLAVLNTVTNDGHGMYNLHVSGGIAVNAASVIFKRLRNRNSGSNWTTLVDFLHHGLFAFYRAVLIELVDSVLRGYNASLARAAVSAVFHGRALLTVVVSTGLVDRAGSISDLVLMNPSEGSQGGASVAAESVFLARDQNLWGQVDVGPGSVSGDLDTIGEDRGGSVGPAGTAVLGNVLVENVRQVVGVVDVVPDPLLWELDVLEGFSNIFLNERGLVGWVFDRYLSVSGGDNAD